MFCFMVGVALSMIPCAMISFILKEKMENLKHMQLVSGMSLPAYWISNMIADIIKVYIPIGLILAISVLLNCNYPGVWAVFLVLPWGLVPFTYLTSFIFSNDTSAQILTLCVNFLVCDVLASMVYTLQCVPETFGLGDSLRWWLCCFPTFCMMNSIYFASTGKAIVSSRKYKPTSP